MLHPRILGADLAPRGRGVLFVEASLMPRLTTAFQEDLDKVMERHRLWLLTDGGQGERADLRDLDLVQRSLWRADLRHALLDRSDLSGADLRGADLAGANMADASLRFTLIEEAADGAGS